MTHAVCIWYKTGKCWGVQRLDYEYVGVVGRAAIV